MGCHHCSKLMGKLFIGRSLTSVEEALQWASNMTWKGFEPVVHLVEGIYEKNITVPKDELEPYEQQWQRSEDLPKWDVIIVPS
ncbi:MAG: hypothetical protein AAFW75_15225 [Cyanobacteria bacterium J06636_16]